MRCPALAALLLLATPALAPAQAQPFDQAIRAAATLRLAAGPTLERTLSHPWPSDDALAQRRRRRQKNKSTGVTLMIVGGAAIVTGAIVGDTGGAILIVGGLGAAGYGFYLYTE